VDGQTCPHLLLLLPSTAGAQKQEIRCYQCRVPTLTARSSSMGDFINKIQPFEFVYQEFHVDKAK
jgi:hypothetical protein